MPTIKLATKVDIQALDEAKSNVGHQHTPEDAGALPASGGKLSGAIMSEGALEFQTNCDDDIKTITMDEEGNLHIPGKVSATGLNVGNSEIGFQSSYLAFVGNVNTDMVDAAFGKNNEDDVTGIGKALVMYAKYKGETTEFKALSTCSTLSDIVNNTDALNEIMNSDSITSLINASDYANPYIVGAESKFVSFAKTNQGFMDTLITRTSYIDEIRNNENTRAAFNRNRIRLLAPGDVSWTVPDDWPTDFIHVQLVGGGSISKSGGYTQFTVSVKPGDVLTGNIGAPGAAANQAAGDVTFAGVTAAAGGNAGQDGSFLVKATSTNYSAPGGFEGGTGGRGSTSPNTTAGGYGDGTLGECEGTGGFGNGTQNRAGTNGAGSGSGYNGGASGGGGYGGAGGGNHAGTTGWYGAGGSGAIVITCPDGYIPEFVVWNTIDGVTEWRRDENIFNDFGESA